MGLGVWKLEFGIWNLEEGKLPRCLFPEHFQERGQVF